MLFFHESIPVRFLGAYDLPREAGWIYTQRNSYYALSIRVSGETDFYINGQELNVRKGELVMIPPNLVYSQYTEGEHIYVIHFDAFKYFNADTIKKQTVKDWDTVCGLFKEIYKNYSEKPKGWYYKASALLYELLCLIHKETDATESKKADSIDLSANYLEKHYTDHSLSVAQLASISGYSEAYFRRLFLKRFSVTPSERIDYLRIERAKRLLESGEHTMSEIAEYVGIGDPKYFSTGFKKLTKISPRDYINRLGG